MRDILGEIWATAKRNRLRTALTGFSVAWGIFMLIFLLGAGNGLINANMQQADRFLSNSMMVFGGQTEKAYDGLKEGRNVDLITEDLHLTSNAFNDHVMEVGVEMQQGGQIVSRGDQYFSGTLTGVYPNYVTINKREIRSGRFINDMDIRDERKVLVISEDQAKELVKGDAAALVGQFVRVGNISFRVVGITKSDKSRMQNDAFVPFTTFKTIYNKGNKVGNLMFSFQNLNTEQENESFEKLYRSRVNSNHRAAPDDEGALWLWNRFTESLQMQTGIGFIRTALWVIGIFTLLSGVVGVSNIMLITVKERTREFGIRKAIGASPSSILWLIIVESVIITTFFGYIGMLLGIAANEYMDATVGHMKVDSGLFEATMFLNPTVGLDVCIEATFVMILAGTIAGMIPARKAARIRPIEALRAE